MLELLSLLSIYFTSAGMPEIVPFFSRTTKYPSNQVKNIIYQGRGGKGAVRILSIRDEGVKVRSTFGREVTAAGTMTVMLTDIRPCGGASVSG